MLPSIGFKFGSSDKSVLFATGLNQYRLDGLDYEVASVVGASNLFGICRIDRTSVKSEYDKEQHKWSTPYESYEAVLVTDLIYENIFGIHDGRIRVKKNGLFGYLDEQLFEVIPCMYKTTTSFHNGLAQVVDVDDNAYTIDVTGSRVAV